MSFELPQDTETQRYSRYDRFKACVLRLSEVTARTDVAPQDGDQFKDLEERFWEGLIAFAESVTAGGSGASVPSVSSYAQLTAIPTASASGTVLVTWENTAGDGGWCVVYWDPTGTDPHDPKLFFRPDDFTTAGGWRQLF